MKERKLKYGLLMPHGLESLDTPQKVAKYAVIAEKSGWDGFFIWDSIGTRSVDPWVTLAAIAVQTETIKIGAMVTPIARRRPWKLAKEAISIDQLSNGRLIFGAGLGDTPVFKPYGGETDPKVRAKMLDEGLEVLDRLWEGEEVNFEGEHYTVKGVKFERPVQRPRIPVWLGGLWPKRAPFRRAAKWDGMMPHTVRSVKPGERLELDEVQEIIAYIASHREGDMDDFEMVMLSYLPENKDEAVALVKSYHEVGVKWWCESVFEWRAENVGEMEARIVAGPPDY